ncbi:MAG: hypothetical protein QOJ54_3649 [Aliidongia sp.]|jgi:DNA/RNA endonuclease YhcR with UshA esterase domain|nr:hypothetical protein [Aliidongia sp.]
MFSVHRCRRSPFVASILLLLSALPPAVAQAEPTLSIAEARTRPVGTSVTVEGTVSSPSGDFASSFSDEGFGLQDRSAGLYVSLKDNLKLAPPARVRVTGMIEDHSGLLVIVPADPAGVEHRGTGPAVVPRAVKTAAIGEATEGRIVRVTGKLTQAPESDGAYGFKFWVNDGSGAALIFVNTQTGIAMDRLPAVGARVSVTGFSSQYDTHYEIDPRSLADIAIGK